MSLVGCECSGGDDSVVGCECGRVGVYCGESVVGWVSVVGRGV